MQPHRFIHDINKPASISTLSFSFSSVNSINLAHHLFYIRIKSILMIDTHRGVIRCKIEHRLRKINNIVNNVNVADPID